MKIRRTKVMVALLGALMVNGCSWQHPGSWMRKDDPVTAEKAKEKESVKEKKSWLNLPNPLRRKKKETAEPAAPPEVATERLNTNEFKQAIALVRQRNFSDAKILLNRVLETNPKNSEVWRLLGDCQYNMMELKAAIKSYTEALTFNAGNYMAIRGKGFAHLHYGHELWGYGRLAAQNKKEKEAARWQGLAHKSYTEALDILQQCLDLREDDLEAMWGRAMTAEGASRQLYWNALALVREGDSPKAQAELQNCLRVINHGIHAAGKRIKERPSEIEPKSLVAGLYFRRAYLHRAFGEIRIAKADLQNAISVQESITDDASGASTAVRANAKRALAQYRKFLAKL